MCEFCFPGSSSGNSRRVNDVGTLFRNVAVKLIVEQSTSLF